MSFDWAPKIEKDCFNSCGRLESIVIPASVTEIGSKALAKCKDLREVKYCGNAESWNAMTKESDWDNRSGEYVLIYDYVVVD